MERTAKGLVDDKENAKNMAYLQSLVQTVNNPNSEGARGGVRDYLANLQTAQDMLAPYMGKTISVNGVVAKADGAAQTFFSATPAQRADPYANYVLNLEPPGPVVPGVQVRDQARLERLAAQNGSAEPVYPAEELLVGGAVGNRVAGTVTRVVESLDVALAGRVGASASGNISARQITEEGMSVRLTLADRSLLSQLDKLASTGLQGEAREYVANNYFVRNGFKPLEGKCGSGNCFDGVYIKGDMVYVNEVKPLGADNSIKLSGKNLATNLAPQMSDQWIAGAIKRLEGSGNADAISTAKILKYAIDNNRLTKMVTGVNKNGMTVVKIGE
ncbi:hypothetical protein [Cupriavidus sp. UME77]|uniref:hypothetical protein n=1 Tax=Cupriavidus sp. UME77 TaxID=1862321 RepID=UPI0016044142|nr:hypothetical protein [Cupriavidus sp. UME77]MBB1630552.1 hypothetical protein [Cupriavidus sp. UME77]